VHQGVMDVMELACETRHYRLRAKITGASGHAGASVPSPGQSWVRKVP